MMASKLTTGCGYMTFAGGFAEANVAKPGAIAEHVFAVGCKFVPAFFLFFQSPISFVRITPNN